ncbi:MAG: hypothetical protein IKW96_06395 [Ruminococcus sp.]|uniref:hypothetical protein n=1 Tax=Ruminococcus sp. TaxID=41978 RepID=UPI0025F24172|nr:hypothetical protein [Ruminococcus sp.]MBR5682892.1 hypothetical protein [Ruminococcus sp.]
MNSISRYQLAAMLIITDVFGLFCLSVSISLMTLYGLLSAAAMQFLLSLISVLHGGRSAKWQHIIYLLYAVFCGGAVFASLWRTSGVIYIPYEDRNGIWGRLLTAGLIALVCLYSSSTGLRAVSRAAVIAAAAGLLCIIIDFASAAFTADWENLFRPEKQGFFYGFARGFAVSGGLGSFFVLLEKTRGERSRAAVLYFGAKAVLTAVIVLTSLAVAGGIVSVTEFPVITAAQLSQPFEAQRIDSLFLVIFISFAAFSVTLQVMTGAYLLKRIFPEFSRWRSCTMTVLILGAALLISGRELIMARAAAAAAVLIVSAAAKNPLKNSADK